jgi:ribosomal protein S18 acetylase RimI-like enzyme
MDAGPAYALRPITDGDLPFLAELYASTRAEELAPVPWPPEVVRAFLQDQFRLQHQHYQTHYPDASFQLVLVDGVPAGRRYVGRWATEICLIDIALLPDYKGLGIGRSLLAELVEESDRSGLPLGLHVEMNNPVLAWYQRLGFVQNGTHGVYLRMQREPRPAQVAP